MIGLPVRVDLIMTELCQIRVTCVARSGEKNDDPEWPRIADVLYASRSNMRYLWPSCFSVLMHLETREHSQNTNFYKS